MTTHEDPLWNVFRSVWQRLDTTSSQILLAGGYGLYLKQLHARDEKAKIAIPISLWNGFAPRSTKDLDFVLGLDLMANSTDNNAVGETLRNCGFTVSREKWQFEKSLSDSQRITIDLHAPEPGVDNPDVKTDDNRVKTRKTKLPDRVHGHRNPEAIGSEFNPTTFTINSVGVKVPNATTWAIMKMTACHERSEKAQNEQANEADRQFHSKQATKHAVDVGRIVALMTEVEVGHAAEVVERIRESHVYDRACKIRRERFTTGQMGLLEMRELWADNQISLIGSILEGWFP